MCIVKSWAAIKGYAEMEEVKQINTIAANLLIASFLFVVISIFPKIFIIWDFPFKHLINIIFYVRHQ